METFIDYNDAQEKYEIWKELKRLGETELQYDLWLVKEYDPRCIY